MARARGDSGLDAFLNVCKERGATSHDVVARVRRLCGTRRVGHAGTLDPAAEGVLPLALGRATRLVELLAEADKEYYAEAVLGLRTTTDDLEGEVVERRVVPDFDPARLDAALATFLGPTEQRPPVFSALKVAGQRAYDLARAGQAVTLASRRVTIYAIERRGWDPPILAFVVRCSKGTYVRSLARDLGERLATGAALRRLVRLRVGPFRLEESITLGELEAEPTGRLLSPDVVLLDRPAIVLGTTEQGHVRHGRDWPGGGAVGGLVRAYAPNGELIGLVAANGGRWRPKLTLMD